MAGDAAVGSARVAEGAEGTEGVGGCSGPCWVWGARVCVGQVARTGEEGRGEEGGRPLWDVGRGRGGEVGRAALEGPAGSPGSVAVTEEAGLGVRKEEAARGEEDKQVGENQNHSSPSEPCSRDHHMRFLRVQPYIHTCMGLPGGKGGKGGGDGGDGGAGGHGGGVGGGLGLGMVSLVYTVQLCGRGQSISGGKE